MIRCSLLVMLAMHGVLSAQPSESQPGWLSKQVTIRVKDGRLVDIVASLEKLNNFRIEIAAPDTERLQARVTIDTCSERVENVLKAILFPAGLSFRVVDDKTVQVFTPATPSEPVTTKVCRDRIDDHLKILLGGVPPPPFELSPVRPLKPATP